MKTQLDEPQLDIRDLIRAASDGLGSKEILTQDVLPDVNTPEKMIRFIHRYQLFNGNFAGGVSCLAGAYHIRQELFLDRSIPVAAIADRSARIASQIYFAAEDEYADRRDRNRVTHRDLGQFLLLGACEFYDIDLRDLDKKYPMNAATNKTLKLVDQGYCQEQKNTEETLLRGLGFHIGSELLADQEFNLIDSHFQQHFPELISFLKEKKTPFGQDHYRWIKLHTYVEIEHLDHAFIAAEMVLECYAGDKSKRRVAELIVDGFLEFGDMQKFFFSHINEFKEGHQEVC